MKKPKQIKAAIFVPMAVALFFFCLGILLMKTGVVPEDPTHWYNILVCVVFVAVFVYWIGVGVYNTVKKKNHDTNI